MTIDELKKAALEERMIDVWSSGDGTLLPMGWYAARVMEIDTSVPVVTAKVHEPIVVTVRGEKRIQQEVRFTKKEQEG